MLKTRGSGLQDESRIIAEGQKDGERNIPEMHSYTPAQFEQALIAHGEQKVQQIYKRASQRLAKLQAVFQALQKRLQDIESRTKPVAASYQARKQELGRDVTIPFPSKVHLAIIFFLGIGEFPLNTVVFRLFGEAEFLTYIMASTLAVTIPLLGLFIGIHLRHSLPRLAGNIVVGLLAPVSVVAALYSVSVLRNTYIASNHGAATDLVVANQNEMAYALFALNALVFFAALVTSFFAHDPDEKLDLFHSALTALDRKRSAIRKKMFQLGTQINGEIQTAKSQIQEIRARTNEQVALYRQTNMRYRRLMAPASFRKSPEFPKLDWWPEVSVDGANGAP